jgi:hypothetical protein
VCVPISRFSILPTSPAKSGCCPESIAFNQLWLPVKVEIDNANWPPYVWAGEPKEEGTWLILTCSTVWNAMVAGNVH